jgi:hypothetical protein
MIAGNRFIHPLLDLIAGASTRSAPTYDFPNAEIR